MNFFRHFVLEMRRAFKIDINFTSIIPSWGAVPSPIGSNNTQNPYQSLETAAT
jgi:hypothetical protein